MFRCSLLDIHGRVLGKYHIDDETIMVSLDPTSSTTFKFELKLFEVGLIYSPLKFAKDTEKDIDTRIND